MENNEMSGGKNTITLRIPKLNVQIVVLSLVAVITLFQTVQLMRISSKVASGSIKSNVSTTNSSASGTGSSSDAPAAMVGGC